MRKRRQNLLVMYEKDALLGTRKRYYSGFLAGVLPRHLLERFDPVGQQPQACGP
jgi:hypothetical protein